MALTSGKILSDAGAPISGNGSNGDHYRNTDNQDFWFKTGGGWTLVGNLNDDAAEGIGTIWLSGAGAPITGNGANSNYYRNTANQDLWYKVGGFWTLIGNLSPVPADGTMILSGAGVPDNGTGSNDDYYRDTVTQNIYLKTAGVWNLIGSWAAVVAGTTILSGSGVPSNGSGSDGNYYFNSVNQDIYFKSGGIWTLIGSWAAGGATAFVVGTWNMTGAIGTAVPVSTLAATVGGAAPNFELTPTAPLAGSVPGSYLALAASSAGVAKTGTGQKFAKLTLPTFDVGDNITAVGFLLVNSSATELDIVSLLSGGSPVNPIWGIHTIVMAPVYGGTSSSQTYANSVAGATVAGPSGWVSSDVAYFGFDYDTGNAVIQKNAGTITQLSALDMTGFPVGDTMKVFVMLGFLSATPTLLDAPVVFSLGTTDGGKTAFTAIGDATLPVGAADGLVYEVTAAGQFGGKQAAVGDYVQLYDTTTKIIVTANPDTVAAAVAPARADATQALSDAAAAQADATQALADASTAQADASTALGSASMDGTVDVMGREALTEVPGMVVGTTLRGQFKFLDVTADAQSFPLSMSGGVDCQILIQASPSYTPGGSDTVSILGYTFKVDSHLGQMLLEHTQTAGGLITNTRVLHKSPSLPVLTQALADAVTSLASLAHVTSPVLELDNSALTGPLASYDLSTASGPWRTLHGEVLVKLVGSTAHGITNFDGTGTALAVGEGVLIRGSSPSTQQYLKVAMM